MVERKGHRLLVAAGANDGGVERRSHDCGMQNRYEDAFEWDEEGAAWYGPRRRCWIGMLVGIGSETVHSRAQMVRRHARQRLVSLDMPLSSLEENH